jgi:hypothetical protein
MVHTKEKGRNLQRK